MWFHLAEKDYTIAYTYKRKFYAFQLKWAPENAQKYFLSERDMWYSIRFQKQCCKGNRDWEMLFVVYNVYLYVVFVKGRNSFSLDFPGIVYNFS